MQLRPGMDSRLRIIIRAVVSGLLVAVFVLAVSFMPEKAPRVLCNFLTIAGIVCFWMLPTMLSIVRCLFYRFVLRLEDRTVTISEGVLWRTTYQGDIASVSMEPIRFAGEGEQPPQIVLVANGEQHLVAELLGPTAIRMACEYLQTAKIELDEPGR